MILKKLEEALAEIPNERQELKLAFDLRIQELDALEELLRTMIADYGKFVVPVSPTLVPNGSLLAMRPTTRRTERDKIDEVADVLREEGRPLHITVIAERLSAKLGRKILRTEIEPGLNRHIAKAKARRVEKYAPSTFGLPEWKASLAKSA